MLKGVLKRAIPPAILAGLLLAGAGTPFAFADTTGAWPVFHGDNQHTGLAKVAGPRQFVLAWYASGGDSFESSPAIDANGNVFVASSDGGVQALHPDGGQAWAIALGSRVYGSPSLDSNGHVIIGDVSGKLRAINTADGTIAWTLSGQGGIRSSPVVGSNGWTYVGTDNNVLDAVDGSGALQFQISVKNTITGSPAIAPNGDVIYGVQDGSLHRISSTGSSGWDAQLDGPVYAGPTLASDGTVYVGAGGSFEAVDGGSGAVKWRVGVGANIMTAPAIGPDGATYVGSENGLLTAVSPSGSVLWQYQTGGAIHSSPAVGADGLIYFGSGDTNVYALNPSGQIVTSFHALDAVNGSIAIGPTGIVYAGARDKRLYALRDNVRLFAQSPADRLGGDLVREASTGRVFVLVDGLRRYIPDPTTQAILGLAGPLPLNLTVSELVKYPEGTPLPSLGEGTLLRESNGPVYAIKSGKRTWIQTVDQFNTGGYQWNNVLPVEDRVARSVPLNLQDGMLVKGSGDRVYLVQGGQRQWISSADVFAAKGYSWSQVHFVTDAAITTIPEGPALS